MLSDRDIVATVAVKNLEAARRFYENTLGLPLITENHEALTYKSGRSMLFVYRSQFASTNKATAATWLADDVEELVRTLKGRGVNFEHYDMPNLTRQGDIHVAGSMKTASFKDPDGNIFSIVTPSNTATRQRPEPQRGRPASARRVTAESAEHAREYSRDLSGLCGSACSPQRSVAKRALDRGVDALARELPLFTQEPDDAVDIRLDRIDVERVADIGLQVDAPHGVQRLGVPSRLPDLVRHALDASVRLHERQRLLRSDPFDAVVEIGADEDREIDERLRD